MCDKNHDHDCNCNEEHEEMETMILTLDDDTELECGIIGVFEVEGKEYIALLPVEDETVLIYEYKEDGENVELGLIEDDQVFEKVSSTFYDIWEQDDDDDEEGEN